MKKYNCNRCNNYSTDCRKSFWQHQNRTKKCSRNNESKIVPNESPTSQLSLTCEYCGKVFTQNGSMNRHKRKSCKVRKKQERERQDVMQQEITVMKQLITQLLANK